MIRIIGDTTSGMTLEQAQALGIEYVPQLVIFGEETYRDDTEIDSATFVKKLMEAKELPKTAAPPPALYNPIFEDMIKKGDTGIVICPSAKLSGTVRSATTALADYPDLDVRIVDTLLIGSPIAEIIKYAKSLVDEGKSLDEVESAVKDISSRGKFYAVVDTLEYLYKGGRIGGAAKLFGDVLQIKPILTLNDGVIETYEKQRTKKKAMNRLYEIVAEHHEKNNNVRFSFSMLDSNPEMQNVKDEFKTRFEATEVPFYNVPPCIMVHAGPNVILCALFTD